MCKNREFAIIMSRIVHVSIVDQLIKTHQIQSHRCTSLNVIRDPYATSRPGLISIIPETPIRSHMPSMSQLQENVFPSKSYFAIF